MELKEFGGSARDLKVNAEIRRNGALFKIFYEVKGDIDLLVLPKFLTRNDLPGRRTDLLWNRTCFELFLGFKDSPEYYEFNFSPEGNWALYHFNSFRTGMSNSEHFKAPRLNCLASKAGVVLETELIPATQHLESCSFDAALSAILELKSGEKLFWALAHNGSQPNFHDRNGFVVRI